MARSLPILLLAGCLAQAAEPVPARLVMIDPGHDPEWPGAWSARGKPEYRFNEEVAALLERELAARSGLAVARTRCDGQVMDNWERGLRANASRSALLVSIHHDSVRDSALEPWVVAAQTRPMSRIARGFSVHVRGDRPESVAVARAIARALVEAHFTPSGHHVDQFEPIDLALGIYDRRQLAILNMSAGPAVLLEVGFIINPEEELELQRPEVRARFVRAVGDGVLTGLTRPGSR